MSPKLRSRLRTLAGLLAGVGLVAVGWWFARGTAWYQELAEETVDESALPSDLTEVLDTAVVTRADVADIGELEGRLVYEDRVEFVHRVDPVLVTTTATVGAGRARQVVTTTVEQPGSRAVTDLPELGEVIEPGDVLYESDSTPVHTAVGAVAAWRTMDADTAGADVAQLHAHLNAGGWSDPDPDDDTVVELDGDEWTSDTTAAVERWQEATGQEVTGEVALGDLWFLDGPIRIVEVLATEGVIVADGDSLFTYTSDRRSIEATVETVPEGLLDADDVRARLPGGQTVPVDEVIVQGTDTGFDLRFTPDLADAELLDVDRLEVTLEWTVNELVDALTLPPEAIRRMDSGTYVVDVLDGDVIRTTPIDVRGQAGRVVAVDGVPERTLVLIP